MQAKPFIQIGDDLTISVAGIGVRVSPSEGLRLAEQLTRGSFRRALMEEAAAESERVRKRARRVSPRRNAR